ncbi:hypothetical protein ADEAN_000037000 [Angomonas deanei]|uniref:Uncharacterized protein n=1 Tax=Angomonas deanei TaxID=59799 RepID=A0A7G2C0T6_9TRYP|nr:hypothetical protein ADEAN_000037000 [Angomonas deanei]
MGGTFIIATAYHNHHDSVSALRSSEEVRYLTKILGVQTYPLQNSEIEENENNQNNENNIPESCWEVSVPQNDRVYLLQGELRDDVRTQLYERSRRLFLLGWFEEDHHNFLQRDASSSSVSLLTDLYIERYLPPSAPLCDIGRTNHFQKLTDLKKEVTVGTKVRLWMTDVYALGTVVQVLEPKEEIKKEESNDEKNNNNHHSNHVTVCIEWLRDDWKEEVLSLHGSDQTLDRENDNRWQPLWYEQTSAGTEGDYVVDYTGVQGKR